MTHPLDDLLTSASSGTEVSLPDGWGQGRAVYGGLVGAVLQAASLGAFDLDPATLRACTTSFVAPAISGPAHLESVLLRRGSSAVQTEVRLWQPDERSGEETVRAVQLSAYGTGRSSTVELAPPAVAALSSPADIEPLPFAPGMMPDFFAHLDLRPTRGGMPFTGQATGDMAGYMRLREAPVAITVPHFIALVDAWPPAPGQCLAKPAPMSTLTWTLELVRPIDPDPLRHWYYEVRTDAAREGYGHTHATVSGPDGTVVAISRQTVTLFG